MKKSDFDKRASFVKNSIRLAAQVGVGGIVANAVNVFCPRTDKPLGKLCNWLGSIAIGWFVTDTVDGYMGETFDDIQQRIESKIIFEEEEE